MLGPSISEDSGLWDNAFAAPRCNLVPCVPCEIPALQVGTYDVSLSFLPLRPLCAASDPVACPAFHTRCLGGMSSHVRHRANSRTLHVDVERWAQVQKSP